MCDSQSVYLRLVVIDLAAVGWFLLVNLSSGAADVKAGTKGRGRGGVDIVLFAFACLLCS